jgi:hypothetical protein
LTAEIAERSIAGQIEFWAQLGRAIEPLLEGSRALALRRARAAVPLSECLASIDSAAGRRRVVEYLESRPFPHDEPIPGSPGLLVRVAGDGTRTVGRFVGREFQTVLSPDGVRRICYIGLSSRDQSTERVAMRVSQGGHDVQTVTHMYRKGSEFRATANQPAAGA